MKYIEVKKEMFDKLTFKVEVSPMGDKLCDCGYMNCVDLDCLAAELKKK